MTIPEIVLQFSSRATIKYSGSALNIYSAIGYFTGLGFSKRNLGIEFRYNLGRDLLASYRWISRYSSTGILVACKVL